MTTRSAPIQVQYLRFPTSAFSSATMRPSHEVVDVRTGPELGLPPDGVASPEESADLRPGVAQVAEHQGPPPARLHARRRAPLGEPLLAEVAHLHDALGPPPKVRGQLLYS